ncbi:hypothetical protein [Methanomethylovorans sp.]|uniref:hypothetical protein n=1 Tax=Methanomethylovorans sp. TaxID=2758717 RepID=UPI003D0F9E6A
MPIQSFQTTSTLGRTNINVITGLKTDIFEASNSYITLLVPEDQTIDTFVLAASIIRIQVDA